MDIAAKRMSPVEAQSMVNATYGLMSLLGKSCLGRIRERKIAKKTHGPWAPPSSQGGCCTKAFNNKKLFLANRCHNPHTPLQHHYAFPQVFPPFSSYSFCHFLSIMQLSTFLLFFSIVFPVLITTVTLVIIL